MENQEDFDNLPVEKLDDYINEVTDFSDWEDFAGEAAKIYHEKNLFE